MAICCDIYYTGFLSINNSLNDAFTDGIKLSCPPPNKKRKYIE